MPLGLTAQSIGVANVVQLSDEDEALFIEFISGSTSETLADGEAATLACAHRLRCPAVIDEKTATALAARRLPGVQVQSTMDILLCPPGERSWARLLRPMQFSCR